MIYVELTIRYRDDKTKSWDCFDYPYIGNDYITITPKDDPTERVLIPNEAIDEISYNYKCDCKDGK
jgi:hypothetical protein